jgi:hypothetical protein
LLFLEQSCSCGFLFFLFLQGCCRSYSFFLKFYFERSRFGLLILLFFEHGRSLIILLFLQRSFSLLFFLNSSRRLDFCRLPLIQESLIFIRYFISPGRDLEVPSPEEGSVLNNDAPVGRG